jgi:heptosyltransferase-2
MKLRKMRFDISILPYPSFRREFNLFSMAVGAKNRYAFKFNTHTTLTELSFLNNRLVEADYSKHNVENNLNLLRRLGISTPTNISYEIFIKESLDAKRFCEEKGISNASLLIGVHVGSDKRGKERRLPITTFAKVCDELVKLYGAKIVVFFGPHEEDLIEDFRKSSQEDHILVHGMDILDVAYIISKCHIFISGDSGLMHLASAMRVPTIAIFGPTNPTFVRPWGVPYEIVSLGLECSPCFVFTEKHPLDRPLIECKIEDKFACIRKIDAHIIVQKVGQLVSRVYHSKLTESEIHSFIQNSSSMVDESIGKRNIESNNNR